MGKEHCCVPWGMAKTLQHRQSAQSLASPIYCRFFYRVFSAFRGTIADLEARHARNQRNTPRGMGWKHFASMYTNRECKALAQAASLGSRRLGNDGSVGPRAKASPAIAQKCHETRDYVRKRIALDLFRADCIQQRQSVGIIFRPATKAGWAEVKEKFGALFPEALQYYGDQAELSGAIALGNRQVKKARLQEQRPHQQLQHRVEEPSRQSVAGEPQLQRGQGEAMAELRDARPLPLPVVSAPATWLSGCASRCPDLLSAPAPPGVATIDPEMPMSTGKLEALLQTGSSRSTRRGCRSMQAQRQQRDQSRLGERPVTIRDLVNDHDQRHSTAVRYRPLDGQIRYRDEEHCRSLCKDSTSRAVVQMQEEMEKSVASMIMGVKPGKVPEEDFLIAAVCKTGLAPQHRVFFVAVVAACGRHGRRLAKQLLIRCSLTHGGPRWALMSSEACACAWTASLMCHQAVVSSYMGLAERPPRGL